MRPSNSPGAQDRPRVVPTPWSARTYEFEINNRDSSHLVVVEAAGAGAPRTNGWRGLAARLRASGPTAFEIAGYGGCWLIAGEAHISTIAVAPQYRGRGLGELLLAAMLRRALNLSGEYSVLEVRASNLTAQALYRRFITRSSAAAGILPGRRRDAC